MKILNVALTIFSLTCIFGNTAAVCYSSKLYSHNSIYAQSVTFGSFPASDNSFYYSDSSGNSIGYNEVRSYPVIINQYPNAGWIWAQDGHVPVNAIVLQYVNGIPTYYCRAQVKNRLFYGELVSGKGCFISHDLTSPFGLYQVLVR